MKTLVVTADDFGLSSEVNEACDRFQLATPKNGFGFPVAGFVAFATPAVGVDSHVYPKCEAKRRPPRFAYDDMLSA